jgi:ABC-type glycerol-3-phosphate transport system substrate-binding protein
MPGFAVVVALLLIPALAAAQSWKPEWDRLVAEAKKEGAVAVAGSRSPDARRVLIERWKKDFPGIEIQYTTGSSNTWVPKVLEERRADKFLWDIFATGPTGGYMLAYAGALERITPHLFIPELKSDATWQGGFDNLFNDEAPRA